MPYWPKRPGTTSAQGQRAPGRALAAQGKHAEAIAKFDAALAISTDETATDTQHLAATLGKAVSLAESGRDDEAVG